MAENEQQKGEQQFAIQRIYVKDISFEAPNAPAIFTKQWQPDVSLEFHTEATKLGDAVFEVVLRTILTNKADNLIAFLIEVKQAGVFTATGFEGQELDQLLHSYCAGVLFPYTREVISDLVNKGSFPQMILAPVNFDAVYSQRLQEKAKGGGTVAPAEEKKESSAPRKKSAAKKSKSKKS